MELKEIIKRENGNDMGKVFLYMDERVLKAYELSAYILSRYFPSFNLREEVDRISSTILYCVSVDIDFLVGHEDFYLSVGDDVIELIIPAAEMVHISDWTDEFKVLKGQQQMSNSKLFNFGNLQG